MRRTLIGAAACALVALTIGYRILSLDGHLGGFENDQFVTLSQAQQVALGDWPMRDFVELGMPLTVMLSAAGQKLFGHTLFAEALVTSGLIGISTAILFVLAWRASGSVVIALLIALIQIAMAPRFYNYPKLLAYAIAIPAFWWYIDRPNWRRLLLVGAAGVIAFLLRHDHGLYVGLTAFVAVALAQQLDARRIAAHLALLGAFALVLVGPYLLFVHRHGGVVPYFQTFVRYANQTAERTTLQRQRLSIDWSQPLVLRVPEPVVQPHVNVRWAANVSEAQRVERARAHGLTNPEPLGPDVVNYALTDRSRTTLGAIVADPAVADTSGIDRRTFVLNDPAYTHVPTLGERAVAFVRSVRILPGALRHVNAAPFLYYLFWMIPLVALVVVFRWGDVQMPTGWYRANAKIIVAAILALLVEMGFLRGSLESRLADVTEVVGVVAAWVAAVALRRTPYSYRSAIAAGLAVVFVLTAMSVEAIENVSHQLEESALVTRNVRAHASNVHALLNSTPPVAAFPPDTPGLERVARYINACTAPDDRVLTLGYVPELFFMSARRFAAGHVWIQPRFFDSDADQQLMIDRIHQAHVPIAITVPEPEFTTEYVSSFPRLTTMLASEYREIATTDFGRGARFRVLARRDAMPTGTYQSGQLPCFAVRQPTVSGKALPAGRSQARRQDASTPGTGPDGR